MVVPFICFRETSKLISKVSKLVYNPTKSSKEITKNIFFLSFLKKYIFDFKSSSCMYICIPHAYGTLNDQKGVCEKMETYILSQYVVDVSQRQSCGRRASVLALNQWSFSSATIYLFIFWFFETGSHNVSLAGFDLIVLTSQSLNS